MNNDEYIQVVIDPDTHIVLEDFFNAEYYTISTLYAERYYYKTFLGWHAWYTREEALDEAISAYHQAIKDKKQAEETEKNKVKESREFFDKYITERS